MARFLGDRDAKEPMDFIRALTKLQEDCGAADLRMSDSGIRKSEAGTLAQNARKTMGGLSACDPAEMSEDDCTGIFEAAWK